MPTAEILEIDLQHLEIKTDLHSSSAQLTLFVRRLARPSPLEPANIALEIKHLRVKSRQIPQTLLNFPAAHPGFKIVELDHGSPQTDSRARTRSSNPVTRPAKALIWRVTPSTTSPLA